MRKILTSLILILATLLIISSTANAASGTCGDNIHWAINGSTLLITGTGDIPDFEYSEKRPWDSSASRISYVEISEGITSIGDNAFATGEALDWIIIPESVTRIGCGLNLVQRYEPMYTIKYNGTLAQWNKINDESNLFTLHKNSIVYRQGDWLYRFFYGAEKIAMTYKYLDTNENIVIPSEFEGYPVRYISVATFWGNRNITSVTIPNSVTYIQTQAFFNCPNLRSVTIPESVTTISAYAFDGCTALQEALFSGSEADWNNIDVSSSGNEYLINALKFATFESNSNLGNIRVATAGGKYTVKTQFNEGVLENSEKAAFIVALYDKNNMLISLKSTSVAASESSKELVFIPASDEPAAKTVKAMLWKNFDTLSPLCSFGLVDLL